MKWFVVLVVLLWGVPAWGAVILEWDCENAPTGTLTNGTTNQPFYDVNKFDGGTADVSEDYAYSGSKSIKIGYPSDEAGVSLAVAEFSSETTTTLFARKYMYFESNWSGEWPIGLKTSRYFSRTDYSTGLDDPNASAYISEKLIWADYPPPTGSNRCPTGGDNCDCTVSPGMNNAVFNLDLTDYYQAGETFGNSLPYIRTGHWYKMETWMVMNSADDVADGTLQVWIDDVLVYSNTAVAYKSTTRGCPNDGTYWQSMWFGGNYSGADCGDPGMTLYRYDDNFYVSTTLDRALSSTGNLSGGVLTGGEIR